MPNTSNTSGTLSASAAPPGHITADAAQLDTLGAAAETISSTLGARHPASATSGPLQLLAALAPGAQDFFTALTAARSRHEDALGQFERFYGSAAAEIYSLRGTLSAAEASSAAAFAHPGGMA